MDEKDSNELEELRKKLDKIESLLEQSPAQPMPAQRPNTIPTAPPWQMLIDEERPPHPLDPYHVPHHIALAMGQQWIYNELKKTQLTLEEILKRVKK